MSFGASVASLWDMAGALGVCLEGMKEASTGGPGAVSVTLEMWPGAQEKGPRGKHRDGNEGGQTPLGSDGGEWGLGTGPWSPSY